MLNLAREGNGEPFEIGVTTILLPFYPVDSRTGKFRTEEDDNAGKILDLFLIRARRRIFPKLLASAVNTTVNGCRLSFDLFKVQMSRTIVSPKATTSASDVSPRLIKRSMRSKRSFRGPMEIEIVNRVHRCLSFVESQAKNV